VVGDPLEQMQLDAGIGHPGERGVRAPLPAVVER
jgi:hypothetical protein